MLKTPAKSLVMGVRLILVLILRDIVNPCGITSYCDWTSIPCPGTYLTGMLQYSDVIDMNRQANFLPIGYCPGGSDYKCCKSG